jgi:hypothetical protein
MKAHVDPDAICREIAGELRDITRWLAGGDINPEEFRQAVHMVEARKLARFGLRLNSFIAPEGTAHFTLSFADSDETCASIDVDPRTGRSGSGGGALRHSGKI